MRRIVALVVATVFVSACASITDPNAPKKCALMGAGAGAVGGGIGGHEYAQSHNDGEAVAVGIGSLVGGAVLGYAICALLREDPPPPPRAAVEPTPTPKPPPAPAPPDPCAGRIVLRGVTFAFDSDEVTELSMATLDVAAEFLQQCPNVSTAVGGHTDSVGSEAYNEGLSQRRAESVRSYLSSHGVSASQLEAKGYGESQPIADNSTDEGRALNRRVELNAL